MKKRVNSYEVARTAGVSRTVVSLVINGKADRYGIAKKTQEKVMAAVRDTGYTPNMTIRDMFLGKRDIIGVGGAVPASLAGVLEQALAAAGYRVQTAVLAGDPGAANSQVTALLENGMATVIVPHTAVPASVVIQIPAAGEKGTSNQEKTAGEKHPTSNPSTSLKASIEVPTLGLRSGQAFNRAETAGEKAPAEPVPEDTQIPPPSVQPEQPASQPEPQPQPAPEPSPEPVAEVSPEPAASTPIEPPVADEAPMATDPEPAPEDTHIPEPGVQPAQPAAQPEAQPQPAPEPAPGPVAEVSLEPAASTPIAPPVADEAPMATDPEPVPVVESVPEVVVSPSEPIEPAVVAEPAPEPTASEPVPKQLAEPVPEAQDAIVAPTPAPAGELVAAEPESIEQPAVTETPAAAPAVQNVPEQRVDPEPAESVAAPEET